MGVAIWARVRADALYRLIVSNSLRTGRGYLTPDLWEKTPKLTYLDMILHEARGEPIILKNGAKAYAKGWMRFFKIEPEDIPNLG